MVGYYYSGYGRNKEGSGLTGAEKYALFMIINVGVNVHTGRAVVNKMITPYMLPSYETCHKYSSRNITT